MNYLKFFGIFCISMAFCVCADTEYFLNRLKICQQRFHSCKSGSKNVFCNCDRMCVRYDNCCFDAAVIKEGWKEMNDEDQHRQYLQMTTCEASVFKEDHYVRQGAFMISSCPVWWDTDMDTRKACELYMETDVRDILPVVDTSTNLTFKNRHCAKCHSVTTYIPWLLEIKCLPEILPPSLSFTAELMTKLHSDHCSYRFKPPNGVTVRYCYQDFDYTILSNFPEGDNNSTCRNRVFSPVIVVKNRLKMHYFRNLQCLIYSKGDMYSSILNFTDCLSFSFIGDVYRSDISLRNLIDFSSVLHERVTKCQDNEIELSEEIGCRRLYCPDISEPSGGGCVDMKYTGDGFILDLLFEVNKVFITDKEVYRSFSTTFNVFLTALGNHTGSVLKCNLENLSKDDIIPGINFNSEESCSVFRKYFHVKGQAFNSDTIESERLWTANYFNNFTVKNTDGSIIRHIANTQHLSCKTNVSVRNPLYLREMISVENGLPCPAVKLQYSGNESDREGEKNNSSLSYFHLHMIIISPLDVVPANGEYFLCIDTFSSKYQLNYQQYDTMDSYRSYINTACVSISIICMVYCLVQFCAFPMFRDGKSDLLFVLVFVLLLSQTCFFVLSHFEIPNSVCEWVGIFHHFTWLVAFTFMFLCPYRFNAEIRDLQTYSRAERFIITAKYVLVGVSLPLFVIICIKITNIIVLPTEKWYGGRLCFISQTFVVLFGFVVPVFFILCGNVFLFISIIHYITSTSSSANSNRSNMVIFIKISTIMGFSWIIGIVAILSRSDVLLLIFEVLANLQGAFITISFSCTNRVMKLYKECFQRIKNKS